MRIIQLLSTVLQLTRLRFSRTAVTALVLVGMWFVPLPETIETGTTSSAMIHRPWRTESDRVAGARATAGVMPAYIRSRACYVNFTSTGTARAAYSRPRGGISRGLGAEILRDVN